MIDIKRLREQPEFFQKKWADRGLSVDVSRLLKFDADYRATLCRAEELQAQRKKASEEIGKIKKAGGDASAAQEQVRKSGDEITALNTESEISLKLLNDELLRLPNPCSDSTPVGSDEHGNKEVRTWGTKPELSFAPKAHWDLGKELGILDLERGVKLSGSGFELLRGAGAQLERALINFFLDKASEHGYTEHWVPFMVNEKTMTGTGQLPKFADDLYKVTDDFWLIPTAEVPLTNIYADEILDKDQLPLQLAAFTPCFRREAGAAGKDTRGILRVHQFSKIELVKIVEPSQSYTELELLVADAEHLLQQLGLHYRVLELCTGDIGFGAAKCYDIEAWAPGVGRFLEVSSCSNFEDFQARRLQLRFRAEKGAKPQLCHTLNGSGLALPRIMIAILETYQREDGGIDIPDALVPYMGGRREIPPVVKK